MNFSRASALIAGIAIATSGIAAAAAPGHAMSGHMMSGHKAITVHIKNFKFNPATLKIHVGDEVTFINNDSDAHTATGDNKTFDSGGLDTNDSWKHKFTKAGTFPYICALHPYMKGKIIVSR